MLVFQAPYNSVSYSIVTDASASNFFNINQFTGAISLQASIFNDAATSYRVSLLINSSAII